MHSVHRGQARCCLWRVRRGHAWRRPPELLAAQRGGRRSPLSSQGPPTNSPGPLPVPPCLCKWSNRRDCVFTEFPGEDSKDVNVNFEKFKLTFSCLGGSNYFKHLNEIDQYLHVIETRSQALPKSCVSYGELPHVFSTCRKMSRL